MTEKIDAVLLCGGKGTRFREVTSDALPKSLYKVGGRELIDYTIDTLDFNYIDTLIFAVDHHSEAIMEWVNSKNLPCNVVFSEQTTPGVLGAIESALNHSDASRFIVCNTDEIRLGLSLRDLLSTHAAPPTLLACMSATHTDHLYYHRVLHIDELGKVTDSELKNSAYTTDPAQTGDVNVGFILFERDAVNHFSDEYGRDWGAVIDPLIKKGLMKAAVMGINYFNVGTRDEWETAETFLANSASQS